MMTPVFKPDQAGDHRIHAAPALSGAVHSNMTWSSAVLKLVELAKIIRAAQCMKAMSVVMTPMMMQIAVIVARLNHRPAMLLTTHASSVGTP